MFSKFHASTERLQTDGAPVRGALTKYDGTNDAKRLRSAIAYECTFGAAEKLHQSP